MINLTNILQVLAGCLLAAFGITLLQHADLVTGGTAGLALGLTYVLPLSFSAVFFIINLPFYVFSVVHMGWKFTLNTIAAVSLLSALTSLDYFLPAFSVHPAAGAIFGGVSIGAGISILFMNNTSLGGANILALFLQRRIQWNPGKVNLSFDIMAVAVGLASVGLIAGAYSTLSIIATAFVLSIAKGKIAASRPVPKAKPRSSRQGALIEKQ